MKGFGKLCPSTVEPSFLALAVGKDFTGVFLEGKFSHLHHPTATWGHWRELGDLNPTGNPSLGHKNVFSQALVFSVLWCGAAGLRPRCCWMRPRLCQNVYKVVWPIVHPGQGQSRPLVLVQAAWLVCIGSLQARMRMPSLTSWPNWMFPNVSKFWSPIKALLAG